MLLFRISGSLAAMSFFGAMFVILSYFSMAVLRKHPTNMVFFLSVSDLLFSIKYIITALIPNSIELQNDLGFACKMQAGWAQFWGLASISWNGMISLNLIIDLHKQGFARTASMSKFYHMWVWGLSAITTGVMFAWESQIGPSGDGTCWAAGDGIRLLFFVPLLAYFTLGIISVIFAFVRTSKAMSDSARRGVMLRMILYVAVFLICWSGPLAHRVYNFVTEKDHKHSSSSEASSDDGTGGALRYLDAIGISIQGFANAMVWLTNPSFFASFKQNILYKYLGCLLPADRIPILEHIEDSRQDINRLGGILRRNIITCILLGVQQSLMALPKNDVTQKDYAKTHVYNWDDLLADEANTEGQKQTFEFIDYAPIVFAHIRELSAISTESYKSSMDPKNFLGKLSDQLAKFSDGRSNSFFIFSPDKKFIIKTINDQEAKVLLDMLPRLHEYFKANHHSLLTRFYGCHGVRVSHGELVHVVVMGNVFSAPLQIHETYDLKGSWVNRQANKPVDPSKLGMDLDFKELRRSIKLDPAHKEMFLQQIQKDALLLCSLNIMDYSLLLGYHYLDRAPSSSSAARGSGIELTHPTYFPLTNEFVSSLNPATETHYTLESLPGSHGLMQMISSDKTEIYMVGLIDVLQQYDRQKKLERGIKVYLLQKDGKGLSSMAPRPYADRFVDGMRRIVV